MGSLRRQPLLVASSRRQCLPWRGPRWRRLRWRTGALRLWGQGGDAIWLSGRRRWSGAPWFDPPEQVTLARDRSAPDRVKVGARPDQPYFVCTEYAHQLDPPARRWSERAASQTTPGQRSPRLSALPGPVGALAAPRGLLSRGDAQPSGAGREAPAPPRPATVQPASPSKTLLAPSAERREATGPALSRPGSPGGAGPAPRPTGTTRAERARAAPTTVTPDARRPDIAPGSPPAPRSGAPTLSRPGVAALIELPHGVAPSEANRSGAARSGAAGTTAARTPATPSELPPSGAARSTVAPPAAAPSMARQAGLDDAPDAGVAGSPPRSSLWLRRPASPDASPLVATRRATPPRRPLRFAPTARALPAQQVLLRPPRRAASGEAPGRDPVGQAPHHGEPALTRGPRAAPPPPLPRPDARSGGGPATTDAPGTGAGPTPPTRTIPTVVAPFRAGQFNPDWMRGGALGRAGAATRPGLATLIADARWLAARSQGESPSEGRPPSLSRPPDDERVAGLRRAVLARSPARAVPPDAQAQRLTDARDTPLRGAARSVPLSAARPATLLAPARPVPGLSRGPGARASFEAPRGGDGLPQRRAPRGGAPQTHRGAPGAASAGASAPGAVLEARTSRPHAESGASFYSLSVNYSSLSAAHADQVTLRPAASLSRGARAASHRAHRPHGRAAPDRPARQSAPPQAAAALARAPATVTEQPSSSLPGLALPGLALPGPAPATQSRRAPQPAPIPAARRVDLHPPRAQRGPGTPAAPPQTTATTRWTAPQQAAPQQTAPQQAAPQQAAPSQQTRLSKPQIPARSSEVAEPGHGPAPTERQLLAALRALAGRSPEARALLREIRRQLDAAHHLDRLRRIG